MCEEESTTVRVLVIVFSAVALALAVLIFYVVLCRRQAKAKRWSKMNSRPPAIDQQNVGVSVRGGIRDSGSGSGSDGGTQPPLTSRPFLPNSRAGTISS